jgi:glycerol-3-phosphate acyltransferase PlsY
LITAVLITASYLIGSIPTGYIYCRLLYGLDIRTKGSCNIGATNVARVTGYKAGISVLLIDAAFGGTAVFFGYRFSAADYLPILCGFTAILGHVFPVFTGFRGGKGVATALGVFLVLCPLPALLSLLIWLGIVIPTRIVSVASLAAVTVFPVAVKLIPGFFPSTATVGDRYVFAAALVLTLLVWITHRGNIKRLVGGTENKFGNNA